MDPLGRLALQLIEKKTLALLSDMVTQEPSQELAPHRPKNDPKRIKIIEIKYLRKNLEIETGYGNVDYSSCLSRQGEEFIRPVGELTTCTSVLNVTDGSNAGNYSALHIPQADIWWYCGKENLRNTLHPTRLGPVPQFTWLNHSPWHSTENLDRSHRA
ncbi:hypothetical protein QTO34_016952 [Cnephaeus nilssonii]|uniref:Uncharacterized protein n=1 Tax=Cnephaeus nilssonii TaxID=3371016 RepID=A0AA40LQT0_CNENI|nr:hypothetical protein QTO34_016952 [Eptesicus nilssonii]